MTRIIKKKDQKGKRRVTEKAQTQRVKGANRKGKNGVGKYAKKRQRW